MQAYALSADAISRTGSITYAQYIDHMQSHALIAATHMQNSNSITCTESHAKDGSNHIRSERVLKLHRTTLSLDHTH